MNTTLKPECERERETNLVVDQTGNTQEDLRAQNALPPLSRESGTDNKS